MSDRAERLWRRLRAVPSIWWDRRVDPVIAVILAVGTVVLGAADWTRSPPVVLDAACTVGVCVLIWWRRRSPVWVAVSAGALIALPLSNSGADLVYNGAIGDPSGAAVFLIALALGSELSWRRSLWGLVPLTAGLAVTAGRFNPFLEMLTIGPWLAGLAAGSRQRAADQLELRARELAEEQEIFAVQSVRYERARIARELHDVVAHCVSLIVVQANAGAHLTHRDPEGAAEAFDSIALAARHADTDIDRLVAMLDNGSTPGAAAGLHIVDELVRRAQASGLLITYQVEGDPEGVDQQSAETAYRIVQEAVTNAVKHAPGAPIEIILSGRVQDIHLAIRNRVAVGAPSGLADSGGAHGLPGMSERVRGCGGVFSAGPADDGAWSVVATLPRRPG